MIYVMYVLSVVLAIAMGLYDWKKDFGRVTVGNAVMITLLSAIPLCGFLAMLIIFVEGIASREFNNFFDKEIF